jgi:hypothetical protein
MISSKHELLKWLAFRLCTNDEHPLIQSFIVTHLGVIANIFVDLFGTKHGINMRDHVVTISHISILDADAKIAIRRGIGKMLLKLVDVFAKGHKVLLKKNNIQENSCTRKWLIPRKECQK